MKINYSKPGSRRVTVLSRQFANYAELPAELRQRIITLTLPDQIRVSDSRPSIISALLSSSKLVRQDTKECLPSWRPVLIITNPLQLNSERELLPKYVSSPRLLRHVRLALYHDIQEWRISCYRWPTVRHHRQTHEGAVSWRKQIAQLPEILPNLHTISLDITMVHAIDDGDIERWYGGRRRQPGLFVDGGRRWLIYSLASPSHLEMLERFADVESDDIVHLAQSITKLYPAKANALSLSGTIAHQQQKSLDALTESVKKTGFELLTSQVHIILPESQIESPIKDVLGTLPRIHMTVVLKEGGYSITEDDLVVACAKAVVSTTWSADTITAFVEQYINRPQWVERLLAKLMVIMAGAANTIRIGRLPPVRRRLIHKLAGDLKLCSRSGDWDRLSATRFEKMIMVSRSESAFPQ